MALYLQVKDQVLENIISGTYPIGHTMPTEQDLCEQYGVSRVTVRKALAELKEEGLIVGVPRQGTVVSGRKGGFTGSLDMIALVAATQDPFFSMFMEYFEQAAEENGSLMLFKQDFKGVAYQSYELFYRLIRRNIRNVVMWPQTSQIDFELLARLRAVGMNVVFFDQCFDTEVADGISVDNHHAVSSLYQHIRQSFSGEIIYIGYAGVDFPNSVLRERAFLEASGGQGRVFNIPWRHNDEKEVNKLMQTLLSDSVLPAGILCNSGGVGLWVAKFLREHGLEGEGIPVAAVDYIAEMDDYPMTAYEQPMRQMAEKAYQRLVVQSNQGVNWQAEHFHFRGKILVCG